jgi:rare lipoprotein A
MIFVLVALTVAILSACAGRKPPPAQPGQPRPYKVHGTWYQPLAHAREFTQHGKASWYGKKFHGRRTSNGEIYDMYAMTAAHKTLPMGTYVRVFNLDSRKSVDVRVNDRGPFVRGRIIDLSYTAAKAVDMIGPGTASVKIQALGAPAPRPTAGTQSGYAGSKYVPIDYYSGNFTFQVGAFTEQANAQRLRQKLSLTYANAHITTFYDGSRTFYRVRVGLAASLDEAQRFEQRLLNDGYPETFIVAE